ncbi:MAG: DUF4388 domain-containing protein [Desulfobacterales bacterium]
MKTQCDDTQPASESNALKGNLTFLGLSDLFQIIGGNRNTGVLHLKSRYAPAKGLIYFQKGTPIQSTCGSLKGIESINSLFGWTQGEFEFREGDVHVPAQIKQSRMEIVLDALRLLDDGKIQKIGPCSIDEHSSGEGQRAGAGEELPIIRGPLTDFSYVVGEEVFSDGKRIIKEGGHGKWISAINEGTVRIKRKTPSGSLDVVRLGVGSYIGSFRALLFGEYSRSASIYPEGNVCLFTLSAERFQREYSSLSPIFQKLILSLDNRLVKVTDRVVDLDDRTCAANGFAKDKKVITEKGAAGEDLYRVQRGNAYIVGETEKGMLPLLALEKDDIFGYNPFLDYGHEPRLASVMGSDDLEMEKIDTQGIEKEFDGLSNTFRNMIYHVGSCITTTTQLAYRLHAKG